MKSQGKIKPNSKKATPINTNNSKIKLKDSSFVTPKEANRDRNNSVNKNRTETRKTSNA